MEVLTSLLLFSITLLLYIIKWKLGRQHLYKMAAKIPLIKGIPMLPLVGHALSFTGGTEKSLNMIKLVCSKIAPPQICWLGPRLLLLITRAEDIEVVVNSPKCLSKDDLYKFTTALAGEGLFSSPVPTWRRHRKAIMPTFNQRILNNFVEVFSTQAEIFISQLELKSGELIDVFGYAAKYALDAVCETAMGICINAQTTDSIIEHSINTSMDIIMNRIFCLPYHYDWIYNLTNHSREERKCNNIIHSFILGVIEKKVTDYRSQVVEHRETDNSREDKRRVVFLEQLIELSENGENWTNEELFAEVATFMIGGSDTSATVISFTMVLLGMHPEIQQKCFEEVIEVLGPDRKLESSDLPKLVYLEKVIKESMRIFPVGPAILRKIDDDVEVGGYTLPKGAGLVLGIIGIHHSEVYYKDPWKFDPERFSQEEISKRHKYAYLPFSAGPRNCVGAKYGMMSLKAVLAVTIRKFRIETVYKDIRDIRVKQSIIIKAVDGFPIRVFPRN